MKYDVIVVGGGHAGIEAAFSAAKKKLLILLITNNLDLIGQMSCNPSIGGIAKGNIVREIDSFGGLMARLIDKTGIQFRMLNKSKGAAVWGNRAQADKVLYRTYARKELENKGNIFQLQGMVKKILVKSEKVCGVEMESGERIHTHSIILAMGTFLNSVIHIGMNSFPAGRAGEPPSLGLLESITEHGIKCGRLKTGTSPRIDARTVNYGILQIQHGDSEPWPFSFSTTETLCNKAVCWIGKSTPETHRIIRENLDRSPLYTGKIKSIGPRYCPSIEDKVVRFGDRDGHILFLEPESQDNRELYLNGLATSLPFDVQIKMVQSINGLENAKILRPGYGIEYSYFQPLQLKNTLESRIIKNLYFAGQINGTSGYEEAACQGLVAGINAAQRIMGEDELMLSRDSSYTGVLIDDLVSRGTEEPYRMFTSRAEHRLKLRQDNCDERLMPVAFKLGFIASSVYEQRQRKWDIRNKALEQLHSVKVEPGAWEELFEEKLNRPIKAYDLLKRPSVKLDQVVRCCRLEIPEDREMNLRIEADVKYRGYYDKEDAVIEKIRQLESVKIPGSFDYSSIKGVLADSLNKFKKVRPQTLGQASRIPGVTPADISILAMCLIKCRCKSDVSHETINLQEQEGI
ncbi:MAG: tRNA uridine-5-carboxymethylaminomethyl(34) synthesis enzyme MnmG [Chitinispirillaceae bacterium]|nr:tRNA uridine-5-carboxymethylaminomethyl(34) synthesis enzyme MnmG [Chitinispirillaceae bacterium]